MRQRFINAVFLLKCAFEFLRRGRATQRIANPQTIVIVQFGKLGDMVCTTPMFHAVKVTYPNSRLIVVGDKVGGDLLAGNTDVDRYLVCGTDIIPTLVELKNEHPDVGIAAGPSSRAFALLYLAGMPSVIAPYVIGAKSSESRFYRLMRRLAVTAPHTIGQYAPREYLRLLEPLGIVSENTEKHITYTAHAADAVTSLLENESVLGKRLIGISASAGNKIKNWPTDRFAMVADYVAERYGAIIIVIGGPGDRRENEALVSQLSSRTRYLDTTNKLSIEELKALIARLDLFVSVDTGPIYIAEAFKVPTIDIVGPMDENEQPPRGDRHIVVVPPFKRTPELYIMSAGNYNWTEARRQAESITVEQVQEAVDTLLA
ncbi:MAG: hypothetical protein JWN18_480 [Parcubacteria group bacterium]|nr:hypothetical protein [Parcubacteria group bacterium]